MVDLKPHSPKDPDGVRVVAGNKKAALRTHLFQGVALFLVAVCLGYVGLPSSAPPPRERAHPEDPMRNAVVEGLAEDPDSNVPGAEKKADAASVPATPGAVSSRSLTPRRTASHRVSQDPPEEQTEIPPGYEGMKDIKAGDYIQALHDAGIYDGIGAFPPPGTSPPLEGLAVPPDYEVPEGYVRHHQTTDDGQDIEPILMYSPDYEFFDSDGNPIQIPDDRVVPPEHAPQGVPGRIIEIPAPREGSPR